MIDIFKIESTPLQRDWYGGGKCRTGNRISMYCVRDENLTQAFYIEVGVYRYLSVGTEELAHMDYRLRPAEEDMFRKILNRPNGIEDIQKLLDVCSMSEGISGDSYLSNKIIEAGRRKNVPFQNLPEALRNSLTSILRHFLRASNTYYSFSSSEALEIGKNVFSTRRPNVGQLVYTEESLRKELLSEYHVHSTVFIRTEKVNSILPVKSIFSLKSIFSPKLIFWMKLIPVAKSILVADFISNLNRIRMMMGICRGLLRPVNLLKTDWVLPMKSRI